MIGYVVALEAFFATCLFVAGIALHRRPGMFPASLLLTFCGALIVIMTAFVTAAWLA